MDDSYFDIPAVIRRRSGQALTKDQPVPRARLLDPDWQYVPASETDVQKTWRKHGWQPRYPRPETIYG